MSFPIYRKLTNQHSPAVFRAKIAPDTETAHPYHFVPACDHRPASLFLAGDMPVLQQFLDFFELFGVRRPEPLSGPPVPHHEFTLRETGFQQIFGIGGTVDQNGLDVQSRLRNRSFARPDAATGRLSPPNILPLLGQFPQCRQAHFGPTDSRAAQTAAECRAESGCAYVANRDYWSPRAKFGRSRSGTSGDLLCASPIVA